MTMSSLVIMFALVATVAAVDSQQSTVTTRNRNTHSWSSGEQQVRVANMAVVVDAPSRLRTEHRRADEVPCIDEPAPRLSWDVPESADGTARGVVQTSYRVVVVSPEPTAVAGARAADSTGAGAGTKNPTTTSTTLWDSGCVVSNQSVLVEYGGPPLPSHSRVEWTVQVNITADGWSSPVSSLHTHTHTHTHTRARARKLPYGMARPSCWTAAQCIFLFLNFLFVTLDSLTRTHNASSKSHHVQPCSVVCI
jgi:hypothetical protein